MNAGSPALSQGASILAALALRRPGDVHLLPVFDFGSVPEQAASPMTASLPLEAARRQPGPGPPSGGPQPRLFQRAMTPCITVRRKAAAPSR